MARGSALSNRSCHILGVGDDLEWMEGYVGLVGSSLAADVVQRTVGAQNQSRVTVWINPVWPWGNETVIDDTTFIHARIEQGGMEGVQGRRLLWNSGTKLEVSWFHFICSILFVSSNLN